MKYVSLNVWLAFANHCVSAENCAKTVLQDFASLNMFWMNNTQDMKSIPAKCVDRPYSRTICKDDRTCLSQMLFGRETVQIKNVVQGAGHTTSHNKSVSNGCLR